MANIVSKVTVAITHSINLPTLLPTHPPTFRGSGQYCHILIYANPGRDRRTTATRCLPADARLLADERIDTIQTEVDDVEPALFAAVCLGASEFLIALLFGVVYCTRRADQWTPPPTPVVGTINRPPIRGDVYANRLVQI